MESTVSSVFPSFGLSDSEFCCPLTWVDPWDFDKFRKIFFISFEELQNSVCCSRRNGAPWGVPGDVEDDGCRDYPYEMSGFLEKWMSKNIFKNFVDTFYLCDSFCFWWCWFGLINFFFRVFEIFYILSNNWIDSIISKRIQYFWAYSMKFNGYSKIERRKPLAHILPRISYIFFIISS